MSYINVGAREHLMDERYVEHMRRMDTVERICNAVGETGGGIVGDLAYGFALDASLADEEIIDLIRWKLLAAYLLVRRTGG